MKINKSKWGLCLRGLGRKASSLLACVSEREDRGMGGPLSTVPWVDAPEMFCGRKEASPFRLPQISGLSL